MILLIDNYDSFSYNLYQLIGELNPDIQVIRNDQYDVATIKSKLRPSKIILSPGPGRPEDAGVTIEVARTLSQEIPTLGVCLGHQAICAAYGATVTYAKRLMHGKQSSINCDHTNPLFKGLSAHPLVARYHSLAVDEQTLPDALRVIAKTNQDEVMAVAHRDYPIFGVQFHPESVMTPEGRLMLKNFLNY